MTVVLAVAAFALLFVVFGRIGAGSPAEPCAGCRVERDPARCGGCRLHDLIEPREEVDVES